MAAAGAAIAAARPSFGLSFTSSSPCRARHPFFNSPPRRQLHCVTSQLVTSAEQQEQSLPFTEPESALVEALLGIQGRGRAASPQQLKDVDDAVRALEALQGVPNPTSSSLIEGRWQLIFTTRPGTASPIQRTFVGVDVFRVFQEVSLKTDDPRVSNVVKFSDIIGELKVEAAARIENGKRILFQFDRAAFSFKFLPFKVPYPVPFRLLGDEAKGWLDTTYLSRTGNIRISRGNKGTTFVLQKRIEPRQRLLEAISVGSGVEEVINELVSQREEEGTQDELLEGEWLLLWASESEDQTREAVVANGLKGLQIVKKKGQMENVVEFFPGIRYCASGTIMRTESKIYSVSMDNGHSLIGGVRFPLEIQNKYTMELLYIDNKIRITQGDKGIMFVHLSVNRMAKSE